MQSVIKGMVQVAGSTYRIVRVQCGHYSVSRILDDRHVGGFTSGPAGAVAAEGIEPELLREIMRTAIQNAKTSWTGHLALG
ncbi:MAG TPA: hypothetical protein VGC79_23530 [Polyangiaceae bacterium]